MDLIVADQYYGNTETEGLGWASSAISAVGNIGGSLIGGIFGSKIAKINSGVANFQAQTQQNISKDNLSVAKIQEETKRLQQAADLERNKMLSLNNQLDLQLKDQQHKLQNKTTQYAIIGGVVAIVTVGIIYAAITKKTAKK